MNKLVNYILIISVILVIPVVFAVIYLSFDEELRLEVVELQERELESIPADDNAYFYLLGLYVEEGQNPSLGGEKIFEKAKKALESDSGYLVYSVEDLAAPGSIKIDLEKNPSCGHDIDNDCFANIDKTKNEYREIVNNNALLISRLRNLYTYDDYQELLTVIYQADVLRLHQIHLYDVYLKFVDGNEKESLSLLRKDMDFWRSVLRGNKSMLMHMMTVKMLANDLSLLSRVISKCQECEKYPAVYEIMEQNFNEVSNSFINGMENEFLWSIRLFDDINVNENSNTIYGAIFSRYLYKKNRSINKSYEYHAKAVALARCSYQEYANCYSKLKSREKEGHNYFSLELIRNPIGGILGTMAGPIFLPHEWEGRKLELKRRLIATKYLVKTKKYKLKNQTQLPTSLPEELWNPFEKQPAIYDEESNQLIMPTIWNQDDSYVGVSL